MLFATYLTLRNFPGYIAIGIKKASLHFGASNCDHQTHNIVYSKIVCWSYPSVFFFQYLASTVFNRPTVFFYIYIVYWISKWCKCLCIICVLKVQDKNWNKINLNNSFYINILQSFSLKIQRTFIYFTCKVYYISGKIKKKICFKQFLK